MAGFLAEDKFKRSVIAALNLRKISFSWLSKNSDKWIAGEKLGAETEDIGGMCWKNGKNVSRTLVFNKNVPLIKKNIDICLLASTSKEWEKLIKVASSYVSLGELKGGIDPAGADEHWKTARTALERIIKGFQSVEHKISTFFIGAAIEVAMASEIWEWLQSGKLNNAGNLTNPNHVASVCGWLVEL